MATDLGMFEFYLDDSGTHIGSPVVVWGGVVGDKHYLDQLDILWRKQLECPCDGKSPIGVFHSYELERGVGEFQGYNQAERDLTRRNFRQILIETGVTVLAYGVSVKDWDQVVRKLAKQPELSAEQIVLGKAIFEVAKAVKSDDVRLALILDQGRANPLLRIRVQGALETAEYDESLASISFSSVAMVPALQAADLVVHEAYRAFVQFYINPAATPRAHARKLFEESFFGQANWMGRREIKKAAEQIERKGKRLRKKQARS